MNNYLILTLLALFLVTGCTEESGTRKYQKKSSNQTVYITPEEVKEKIYSQSDFVLVDIRPYSFYYQAHIDGAISVAFEELVYRYKEINPESEIILYCQTGLTCLRAFEILSQLGFKDIKIMFGGILQWEYGLVVNNSNYLL